MRHELPAVRIALPSDEEEVMAMCRRLHAENGLFSLNEDKVRSYIRKCYDQTGTIVGVIGEPGHIEASTCLLISDFYYTDDWHIAELWNFVDADYRRSRNAEALIAFGKSCSDKMRVPFFTGIITNKQMAGKVRLYRRSLGYPTGAFFIYNANWRSEPMTEHGDLRRRLREAAQACHDGRVPTSAAKRELGTLFREAADALEIEDNMWGASKPNGSAVHADGVS